MLKFLYKSAALSLIFLSLASTMAPSQAGQSNGKIQRDKEEATTSLSLPYPKPFDALPDEINQLIFESGLNDYESIRRARSVSKEWYHFMSAKVPNIIKGGHDIVSANYSFLTSKQAIYFRHLLHCFPEHYPMLFQRYTTLDPMKDIKIIKLASDVLKSPNLQVFFEECLEPIELEVITKSGVNEKNEEAFFINIKKNPKLYPQFQQYFMGIYLLAKSGHKKAEEKRHSFSVLVEKALKVFDDGLMKKNEKIFINNHMKEIFQKHSHLMTAPFWTSYLASSNPIPIRQAQLLYALLQSPKLKKDLDLTSISSYFFGYLFNAFPETEQFFAKLYRNKELLPDAPAESKRKKNKEVKKSD